MITYRSHRYLAGAIGLCALVGGSLPSAFAQTLNVITDRTVANGNPVNGTYERINIGFNGDNFNDKYPGVKADITGGTADLIYAAWGSTVNITGGTFGKLPSGGMVFSALLASQGATINFSGGTVQAFSEFGRSFGAAQPITTVNVTGGSLNYVWLNDDVNFNMSGGQLAKVGNSSGVLGLYGFDGTTTANLTGGTTDSLFLYANGTLNIGGTFSTKGLSFGTFASGTANITGGIIPKIDVSGTGTVNLSGGTVNTINILGNSIANVTGSGLNAALVSKSAVYDAGSYSNVIAANYTLTGTLADGTVTNTAISGGGDVLGDSTALTFTGPTLAPDLFVDTDQTINDVYNYVTVGINNSPTVTFEAGANAALVDVYNDSQFTMTGGDIQYGLSVNGNSHATITGGNIVDSTFSGDAGYLSTSGTSVTDFGGTANADNVYTYGNSTFNVNGGTINYSLYADGNSTVNLSAGAAQGDITVAGSARLNLIGTGLAGSGNASSFWNAGNQTNYLKAGNFTITGTLADGSTFDRTLLASDVTGSDTLLTVTAAEVAPDLYLITDTTVNSITNRITIGYDQNFGNQSSPTVTLDTGADVGIVYIYNKSVVTMNDGLVHGSISVNSNPATLNLSGGTVGGINNVGNVNMTGGTVAGVYQYGFSGLFEMTGGTIGLVNLQNGTFDMSGGIVGQLNNTDGLLRFRGGSILAVNMAKAFGFGNPKFDIYGTNLLLGNATAGTLDNRNGIFWNVTGFGINQEAFDFRYFEVGGNLSGATGLRLIATSPEPGAFALLATGLLPLVGVIVRRRNKVRIGDLKGDREKHAAQTRSGGNFPDLFAPSFFVTKRRLSPQDLECVCLSPTQ